MATAKKMDLLTAVEQIVEKAKDTGLSEEFYHEADRYIKYVAKKLGLTREQSVMMALFIDNSDDESISISQLGKFLGCGTTRIIRYMADIDVFGKRELVRCSRRNHRITYRVPMEVIEAFKKNEKYVPNDCSGFSCASLFVEIESLFELRDDNELTYDALVEKMHHLFDCNNNCYMFRK